MDGNDCTNVVLSDTSHIVCILPAGSGNLQSVVNPS